MVNFNNFQKKETPMKDILITIWHGSENARQKSCFIIETTKEAFFIDIQSYMDCWKNAKLSNVEEL